MGELKLLYRNIDFENLNVNASVYTIKDFLSFFDLSVEDTPKLIELSEQIKKDKQFVFKNKRKLDSLTEREMEVFKLVVKGKKSNEIGACLFVETATISTHGKHIKEKLELKSTYDWYKYAKSFNILKL